MRIAVLGAGGRVGDAVVRLIRADDALVLTEPLGRGNLASARLDTTDLVIDFSAPAATLALFDRLSGRATPVVVGTTGFDPVQTERLRHEGAVRPILVGANLTPGFEAFRRALMGLAVAVPMATLALRETYNAGKKPDPSGTTRGLLADLDTQVAGRPVALDIRREGETPGINSLCLDLGTARIDLTLTVLSRDAYASGALAAARWLVHQPMGFYRPADMS